MKVYLIRHGETDWNVQNRMQGQTDVALNEKGRAQARAAIADVAKLNIGRIISSDLLRARETAEIIKQGLENITDKSHATKHGGGLEITFDRRLREFGFGNLEGKLRSEIYDSVWAEYIATPEKFGAETVAEKLGRVKSFLADLSGNTNDGTGEPSNILVVTHGGILKFLSYFSTRMDKEFDEQEYLAYYKNIVFENAQIVEINVDILK